VSKALLSSTAPKLFHRLTSFVIAANFDFKGKVIAITGGASGIGLATAKLLGRAGAKLSLADVNEEALKKTVAALEAAGGTAIGIKVDVRDSDNVDSWIKQTVKKYGKLDGAVNLAGIIPKNINIDDVETLNNADWQITIDINLTGVMYSMRAEIGSMNEKGSIVNAASIGGIAGFPKNSAYTAAKHGVIGLTRAAAKEVGDRLIRVNAIAPGSIETEMHRAAQRQRTTARPLLSAIKRTGEPEEVAALIAWLLSDQAAYITGSVQVIDGGWIC